MNAVPVSEWETWRQEVSEAVRGSEARRLEFGGHPKGHDVAYWIRNIRIYNARGGGR